MIELVSVEVVNFRSYSQATFTPLGIGQGMTAINGANGSGKSSIVHALVWALYGVTPDGVPVKALRRQGSEGEVRATVSFRHEGQLVSITRALRGRNDSTIASISLDGVEQTAVSTKTATAWIVARLGLDAEAFLIAFVVRQKELDSLIKARPAERRKTIERLAGIERMSQAIELARADSKAASRLFNALPITEDPQVSKDSLDEVEASYIIAEEYHKDSIEVMNSSKKVADEAQSVLSASRILLTELNEAKHAKELSEQSRHSTEIEVSRLEAETLNAVDIEVAQEDVEITQEARLEAERSLKTAQDLIRKAEEDNARAGEAEERFVEAKAKVSSAEANIANIKNSLESFPDNLESESATLQTAIAESTEAMGAARGEWDRLKKAIDTLESVSAHSAVCPTCSQNINDSAELIATLKEAQESARIKGTNLKEETAKSSARLSEISNLLNSKVAFAERLIGAEAILEQAISALAKADDQVSKMVDIAENSAEASEKANKIAEESSNVLPVLKEKERKAQEILRYAESAEKALISARSKLANAEEKLKEYEEAYSVLLEKTQGLDLAKIEDKSNQAALYYKDKYELSLKAENALESAKSDVRIAKTEVDRALLNQEARKNALAEVEKTAAIAATLEEFRRDRLARLAPELSEVASDFVSRMTEGRYIAVELDEEFTPILTDSTGAQRPSAWLSGGEESAVALALRIAIGEVLAGQRGGLLILDEVLTAQDKLRRQATMGAIRALPRQIITINHVSESTDMVDLVAEVVDDGEGASTLMDTVPADSMGKEFLETLD
jgi:exonuclease SbcC